MFRSHIFASLCLLLVSLCSVAQAETIHVQWGATLPLTTLKQAESTTVQNIVNTKAEQYIGVPLSAKRQLALKKYLATQARAFVSSMSELETTPYPDGTNNTIFDIQINTSALHQLIRELGVIYTCRTQVPYTLILHEPKATEKQKMATSKKLAELELISGLIRKPNMSVQLTLSYKAPLWYATITPPISTPIPKPITPPVKPVSPQTTKPEQVTKADQFDALNQAMASGQATASGQANLSKVASPAIPAPVLAPSMPTTISAEAPSLDSVWRSVWGSYLSKQQQIAAQTAEIYSLRIWGWKNASAIEQLHQKLQTWEASLQNLVLATIDIQHGTTAATWQMHVLYHDDLIQRLKEYTSQQGVNFTLEKASALKTQSSTQMPTANGNTTLTKPANKSGVSNVTPTAPVSPPVRSTPLPPEKTAVPVQDVLNSSPTNKEDIVPTSTPLQTESGEISVPNEMSEKDTSALPTEPSPEAPRKWYEAPRKK